MKVREIHIRKGVGGYHATATTDKTSSADLPDGGSETGRKDLSAHSDDLMIALKTLKHRMRRERADWRRARVVSNIGPTGRAAVLQALGESFTEENLPEKEATMKDFLSLFDQ